MRSLGMIGEIIKYVLTRGEGRNNQSNMCSLRMDGRTNQSYMCSLGGDGLNNQIKHVLTRGMGEIIKQCSLGGMGEIMKHILIRGDWRNDLIYANYI